MTSQLQNRRRRTTVRSAVSWLAFAASAVAHRVVPVGFSKANVPAGNLVRRASFSATLINEKTAYFAKVQVGTPPQTVTLHIDTGSSDLWLLSDNTDLCNSNVLQEQWGQCVDTFNQDASSTFEVVGDGDFSIRYVDETGASGDYFTDNVKIGDGQTITGLQMGLAHESTSNWGMLGIGMPGALSAEEPYPNIIDLMYEQGLIATKAYSLYLDDYDAETGQILFGGLDTEKFHGTLTTVPLVGHNISGQIFYDHFTVPLTSITAVGSGQNSSFFSTPDARQDPLYVILDSGTSLTYLPASITSRLYSLLDAVDDSTGFRATGQVYVDCNKRRQSGLSLSFQFNGPSGPIINVPASELIIDDLKPYIAQGFRLPSKLPWPDERVCRLGIMTADHEPPYLVGDTFLRSAYVVYDLTNHAVAMAQSNIYSDKSNIIEIPAGGTIPTVTGAAFVPRPTDETDEDEDNAGVGRTTKGMGGMAVGVAAIVGAMTLFGF